MKKLLVFISAVGLLASCAKSSVEEVVTNPSMGDVKQITVSFDGDDTRIQLNEETKTVWTSGDAVSVFYRTDGNSKWIYEGETGARSANLSQSIENTGSAEFDNVVVVYPYSYYHSINSEGTIVAATILSDQSYLENSYGVGSNLMVAMSSTSNFNLKNVCGWLKLQLTGDGEVVEEVIFSGNNGEQVAGTVYVNAADATIALAEDEADIKRSVSVKCSEGVELSAEPKAFYISLPPQTFDNGITVNVLCQDGSRMVKSSSRALTVERNYIVPMEEVGYTPEPFYVTSDALVNASYKGHAGTISYGIYEEVEDQEVVATADVDWITIVKEEAEEGESLTPEANNISYTVAPQVSTESRTGVITLTYGEFSDSVVVEQEAGVHDFVIHTNDEYEMNYEAHEVSFGYELSLPKEDVEVVITLSEEVDWITDITNTYNGAESVNGSITFNVAEHTQKGDREVTMNITYGDKSKDIRIIQIDNFPDDVVMNVAEVSARVQAGSEGAVWELILIENDPIKGTPYTRITVGINPANVQYINSDTYTKYVGRKKKGIKYEESMYRYTGDQAAITECELTVDVNEETETAAISGYFIAQQFSTDSNKWIDVHVSFAWDGPVGGFLFVDPTAEVTEWESFYINRSANESWAPNHTWFNVQGTSADSKVNVEFNLYAFPKGDPYVLLTGEYAIAETNGSGHYCTADSKINGTYLTSGTITVEEDEAGFKLTYDVVDANGTNLKGTYVGPIEKPEAE